MYSQLRLHPIKGQSKRHQWHQNHKARLTVHAGHQWSGRSKDNSSYKPESRACPKHI
jgi:hypothetical protein